MVSATERDRNRKTRPEWKLTRKALHANCSTDAMIADVQILVVYDVRFVFVKVHQEVIVLRLVGEMADVEFERCPAVGGSAIDLVVDTLLSALVDEKIVPETECYGIAETVIDCIAILIGSGL